MSATALESIPFYIKVGAESLGEYRFHRDIRRFRHLGIRGRCFFGDIVVFRHLGIGVRSLEGYYGV